VVFATFLPVILAAFFSLSTPADLKRKPWIEKDWTRWGAWDCDYVGQYSPWVWLEDAGGRETGPTIYWGESEYYDFAWIQISSAMPIRQAVLRDLQLRVHYDRMNPQKRAAFDKEHAEDLDEGDSDRIRVWVGDITYYPSWEAYASQSFKRGAAIRLSDGTLLLPTHTKSTDYIGAFRQPGTEYVFPRSVNGKPAFSVSDNAIQVVLGYVDSDSKDKHSTPQRHDKKFYVARLLSFPVASLMYKGKLEY
jgi:hypothetical protein